MSKLHKLVATTAIVSTVAFGLSQVADADTYTVKKGDTLWDIAVNNGTTVDQLMHDNNLTSSSTDTPNLLEIFAKVSPKTTE